MGPDSSRSPGAQRLGVVCCRAPEIPTDGSAPLVVDPELEYSTEQVVLFCQPPSCFSQWFPSSFVVDDVPHSCAEQFRMAEKARLFQDRRTGEIIGSSSDSNAHKRIGRGVRNFDNAVWDRVREDAVLAGNFAKFSQNPTIKHHILSACTNRLAEDSPFDPVWGIGLRVDDPEANNPRRW